MKNDVLQIKRNKRCQSCLQSSIILVIFMNLMKLFRISKTKIQQFKMSQHFNKKKKTQNRNKSYQTQNKI